MSESGATAAIETAKRYGEEMGINPFVALLQEVRRAAGHVAWLGAKVAQAPSDDALLDEYAPWVRLYKSERAALVKASETAIKLGLAERVVRVEERRAELVARVLLATLNELGLPPEMAARAPMILREQLLALEAESVEVALER
jgi:hypothetical protein